MIASDTKTGEGSEALCPQCGSLLDTLVSSGRCREQHQQPLDQPEKKKRRPYRKPSPKICELKEARKLIRIEMLAQVPGITRAKARIILARFPTIKDVAFARLEDLASLTVGRCSRVTWEEAEALKNVLLFE